MMLPTAFKVTTPMDILLKDVTNFQAKARELLKDANAKIDDIKSCLNTGLGLEIEISEVSLLQSCLDRRTWLEHVKSIDNSYSLWTIDDLNKCIEAGSKLDKNPKVEQRIASLKELKSMADAWEVKAKGMINPTKMNKVEDFEKILEEAKKINLSSTLVLTIKGIIQETSDWIAKVNGISRAREFLFLDELESIASKGKSIPVFFNELHILDSQINGAKLWKKRCVKAFLRKHTTITLLEALIPRLEIVDVSCRGRKTRWSMDTLSIQKLVLLLDLESLQNSELSQIREIRTANLAKRNADTGESLYCVCQTPINNRFMIRCEICLEWFHATCVPLRKLDVEPMPGVSSHTTTVHKIASGVVRYLCSYCKRSRRPKLDVVLQLLTSLQELPIRLPESEALISLVDRAVAWLNCARTLLKRPDIEAMLCSIQSSTTSSSTPFIAKSTLGDGSPKKSLVVKSTVGIGRNDVKEGTDESGEKRDHGEHLAFEQTYSSYSSAFRNGHGRKDSIIQSKPFHSGASVVSLSFLTLKEIEDIVLEGDLMEVTIPESNQLWRLLETTKSVPVVPNILDLHKILEKEILHSKLNGSVQKEIRNPGQLKPVRCASGQSGDEKKRNRKGSPKGKILDDEVTLERKMDFSHQEYDEDCAAEACRKPLEKEVNWIQCDSGCELWFHLVCVDLKESDVKKMEHYQCQKCKQKKLKGSCSSDKSSRVSQQGKR